MELIDRAREMIKDKEYDREGNSRKCFFVTIDGRDYALLVYKCDNKEENMLRLQATCDLCEQGLSTPYLIGIDYEDGMAYEIQERVHGKTMAYRNVNRAGGVDKYMNDFIYTLKLLDGADKSALLGLLSDARILHTNGYSIDCHPDNFLIDKDGNITFIDIDIYQMPKKTDENFFKYVTILPYILSFSKMYLDQEPKYMEEAKPYLDSIGHKWFEVCVEYLSLYDLEFDEVRSVINRIPFHYFLMDQAEIDHMIYSYFTDDRIIFGKGDSNGTTY